MRLPVQRSLFMRMLLYFIIIVSFITILLSYILYAVFERSALASLNNAHQRNLSQVSFSSSYMNESAKSLLWSVFNRPSTTVLMYQDESDIQELVPEIRRLNDLVETYPFVQSIYIYNQKLDRYITTGASPVNTGQGFYDREVVQWISRKQLPLPSEPTARMMPSPNSLEEASQVYTYMLYDMHSETAGVSGAVFVNIKAEYLQNLIDSFHQDADASAAGYTLVLSPAGQVMNHLDQRPFLSDAAHDPFFQKIRETGKEAGWFKDQVEAVQSLVIYVTSQELDWIFVQILPYGSVLARVQHIRVVTAIIGGFILLASIAASILLSRRLYRPIGQLVTSAQRVSEGTGHADPGAKEGNMLIDLHILQHALTQAYVSNQGSLQNERRMMLKRLITDPNMPDEMGRYIIEKYGFSINEKGSYRLLLAKVDRYAEFLAQYSEKDRNLLCYGIVNASSELYSAYYTTNAVDLGEGCIGILLSLPEEEPPQEEEGLAAIARELQHWCGDSLHLTLTVTVGSRYADLSQIRQAHHESQQLSYYRLVHGQGSIIHSGRLGVKRDSDEHKLQPKDEQALREALIDGKITEVMRIYDSFMAETALHKYEVIMSNVLYLTYVVHNTLLVMEENSLDEYDLDLSKWTRQIHQAETLNEIRDMFQQVFTVASETVNSRKQNRNSVLVDSVIALLETRYSDMNLSLDSIADEIGMSKDYISKMFRKACGKSISDYLLDLRISKVIQLMEDPELDFSDILDQVGIENKKYFYSLFKKKMGASLRDYRLSQLSIEKNRNLP